MPPQQLTVSLLQHLTPLRLTAEEAAWAMRLLASLRVRPGARAVGKVVCCHRIAADVLRPHLVLHILWACCQWQLLPQPMGACSCERPHTPGQDQQLLSSYCCQPVFVPMAAWSASQYWVHSSSGREAAEHSIASGPAPAAGSGWQQQWQLQQQHNAWVADV